MPCCSVGADDNTSHVLAPVQEGTRSNAPLRFAVEGLGDKPGEEHMTSFHIL